LLFTVLITIVNMDWRTKQRLRKYSFHSHRQCYVTQVVLRHTGSVTSNRDWQEAQWQKNFVWKSKHHKFNFHAQSQPFWNSLWNFLEIFLIQSLPLPNWYLQIITSYSTQRALMSAVCIQWIRLSMWCVNCI
jgi:hypothetical protein